MNRSNSFSFDYEVVVIGSGFGGAIVACRTAKKWRNKVMVLERGKRYPMGSFPRSPREMARNFWNLPNELRRRRHQDASEEMHGLFDIRNYDKMDAVVCAGLGGGSLIYANVFLEPPARVFQSGWPENCTIDHMQPYFDVVRSVLGARPIPQNDDPRRGIIRTQLFQDFANAENRNSRLLDINVFFGNDIRKPTPMGTQEVNRYGAIQTSCVYCGECDVGCNTHSKNTLDLNYLFVAEHRYGTEILTEHMANKIIPLNCHGEDDTCADGRHGYRVVYQNLSTKKYHSVRTRRVVVSAGTLGSTELLLRCRNLFESLPRISTRLGSSFSGNGDFLSFVKSGQRTVDPNYGPVITQAIDFNMFDIENDNGQEPAFLLEDAGYPAFLSWSVEGARVPIRILSFICRSIKNLLRGLKIRSTGRVGHVFSKVIPKKISDRSSVLLFMGIDQANGTMSLDNRGYIDVHWPRKDNMPLYNAYQDTGKRFRKWVQAKKVFGLPNWWKPFRNNVTVHPLGGCNLADCIDTGVTSAEPDTMGQVFGYKGLYVADGSIVPTAVGANPSATISALAERVAEGITGIPPDEFL